MPRPNKVWFRKDVGWWMVTLAGEKVRLAEKKNWGPTTQYNARRSLFRVFSWAEAEGIVLRNPLKGMKRPKPAPRGRALTEGEFRRLLKAERTIRFKTFLFALWATGCRPKEARTLKWDQVRDGLWVLVEHKTAHKTRKPRLV